MCTPLALAGIYAGGVYAQQKAQSDAYRGAAAANQAALARQQQYQQQINRMIQDYVSGMNIGQGIAQQRADMGAAITQAMQQAPAFASPVASAGRYAQRLAQDRASRNQKIADALAAMEGWRNYASQEAINRARLAQKVGTTANYAAGRAAVDKLAVQAAGIPNQDAMAAGQMARDISLAVLPALL